MEHVFRAIKDAADMLNSQGIFLMDIRVPESLKDDLYKEVTSSGIYTMEDIDVLEGKTIIQKFSYQKNTITIHYYTE